MYVVSCLVWLLLKDEYGISITWIWFLISRAYILLFMTTVVSVWLGAIVCFLNAKYVEAITIYVKCAVKTLLAVEW